MPSVVSMLLLVVYQCIYTYNQLLLTTSMMDFMRFVGLHGFEFIIEIDVEIFPSHSRHLSTILNKHVMWVDFSFLYSIQLSRNMYVQHILFLVLNYNPIVAIISARCVKNRGLIACLSLYDQIHDFSFPFFLRF